MTDRWYAIRAVYEHGRQEDGAGVFCERLLLFRASEPEVALEQAERESTRYLELNPDFRRIGEWSVYRMLESLEPENGAEVWSMLYLDRRSGEDFYREHYKELEVPPDDEG